LNGLCRLVKTGRFVKSWLLRELRCGTLSTSVMQTDIAERL